MKKEKCNLIRRRFFFHKKKMDFFEKKKQHHRQDSHQQSKSDRTGMQLDVGFMHDESPDDTCDVGFESLICWCSNLQAS